MPLLRETREALANRLAPLRTAGVVLVRGLPNRVGGYGQLGGEAQILVGWKEDRPEAPELTDEIFQLNRQDWEFEVRSPEMQGEAGLEVLLEAVHLLIQGFAPPNCQKAYLKGREFSGRTDQYWFATAVYTIPCYMVEVKQTTIDTLLSQVQVNDDFGGLTVGGIPI